MTDLAVTCVTLPEVADELLEMLGANGKHLPALRRMP